MLILDSSLSEQLELFEEYLLSVHVTWQLFDCELALLLPAKVLIGLLFEGERVTHVTLESVKVMSIVETLKSSSLVALLACCFEAIDVVALLSKDVIMILHMQAISDVEVQLQEANYWVLNNS